MISVFAVHKTPRLEYVLDFCFGSKNLDWQIITSSEDWSDINGLKLNYSDKDVNADMTIRPHGILFRSDVKNQHKLSNKKGQLYLDESTDPLGIIFFLLSRIEEYGDNDRDKHDRFRSGNHSLVKLDLHKKPVADDLVMDIWDQLKLDYSYVLKRYQCVPSFDIDIAWAYKNRRFLRWLGGYFKSRNKKERLDVLRGKEKDPYDTYQTIYGIGNQVDRIICFALLGDWSKYDKNIHWKNYELGSLLRGLNAAGGMGIHPSYESYLKPSKISDEIDRLEKIVGHKVSKSRQHYLRVKIPDTYRILLQLGITKDYSMGFADNIGFRAGTSFPFMWFDLKQNKKTDLLIFPFSYMDSALKDYLKLSPAQSVKEVETLIKNTKKVGGVFMFVWHNSSINDRDEWKGWKSVLDHTMSKAVQ